LGLSGRLASFGRESVAATRNAVELNAQTAKSLWIVGSTRSAMCYSAWPAAQDLPGCWNDAIIPKAPSIVACMREGHAYATPPEVAAQGWATVTRFQEQP
jgi:hypothetical protein